MHVQHNIEQRSRNYLLLWKSNEYCIFVCARSRACVLGSVGGWAGTCACARARSLTYPACKPHAPYYVSSVASLVPLYFSTSFYKRCIFRKTLLNVKYVLIFSTTFM